jgi:PAS domain-containing protein
MESLSPQNQLMTNAWEIKQLVDAHDALRQVGILLDGEATSVPSDEPRTFRRKSLGTSLKVVAVALGLRDEEQAFELPARLFEQVPFAVYVCDRDGLVLRYNQRAAEPMGPVA